MPLNHDTSFLDHLAPNVAVQFLDRVAETPDRRGLPVSRAATTGSR